ncbi:MAG TPA: GDP-mannose 4,6-dehydratase, partial [Fimbriimonadaceae bacterium]|nr:GDP-mannose 4,6-dehydratase [Fimbriimonadaceae bacterium]
THLIPSAMLAAQGRRGPLELYGTDYPTRDGTAERDYIHVSDLAAAHVLAVGYLAGGGKSTALNLGSEKGATVREVLQAVEEVSARKVPYVERPRRAGDAIALRASAKLAHETLGWKPVMSDLRTICETAWNWYSHAR